MFITFEGPEGSGKTTHADLLTDYLEDQGRTVNLTREPGGTPLGEKLRDLLLDPAYEDMNAYTELFMYLASRAQHVTERIRPALNRGEVVISDRFADASLIYQGIGRELGKDFVETLNRKATRRLTPDLTVILDIPVEEGLQDARRGSRTRWNTDAGDRLEQESNDFHHQIREAYRELADRESERCLLLDRSQSIETLQSTIREEVDERLTAGAVEG